MIEIAAQPTPWVLDAATSIVRLSPRPPAFRQPDFDERYDGTTVVYDAFVNANRAVLLGPPFENLAASLADLRARALPSESDCPIRRLAFDRHAQLWVELPAGTEKLELTCALGNWTVELRSGEAERFTGKRVLFTLSKNNRPEWIADWIRFHRDVHGANAVLLYDNASSAYSLDELQSALDAIEGIDAFTVVPWPFKYGAQGFGGSHWDSDYCQIGAMQDARLRFLPASRSVLNLDVDEFVVSPGSSAFALVENAPNGYLSFFGEWVIGTNDRDRRLAERHERGEIVRHADFQHVIRVVRHWERHPRFGLPVPRLANRSAPKWGVVPARCPESAHWTAHAVTGIASTPAPMHRISYRHFREINTGWKYDRFRREAFDARRHRFDPALTSAYAQVRWDH